MRCRALIHSDFDAAIDLLHRGFPERGRDYWARGFERLKALSENPDAQGVGYALVDRGALVGIVLSISNPATAQQRSVICNLSSWYVEPAYRVYAPILIAPLLKQEGLILINISPAPHTRPVIEAQGFAQYVGGQHFVLPILASGGATIRARAFDPALDSALPEHRLLSDHLSYGCICVVLHDHGTADPYIFVRRRIARGVIPAAQLVYARNLDKFAEHARQLGVYLLKLGICCVILDVNEPLPGLTGRYFRGKAPKYYRGPDRPHPSDLSYTELVIFGP